MDPAVQRRLVEGAETLGIELPPVLEAALLRHLELLLKWNRTYNLTAITDPMEVVVRHTLDSLSILPWITGARLADVGSGGGFPGIPIAIMNPAIEVITLDSRGKKVRFMDAVRRELSLGNLNAVHQRVEQFQPPQQFDTLVSRAFASLARFFDLSHHLLADGGQLLAMKGDFPKQEMEELQHKHPVQIRCESLEVPFLQAQRHLIIISTR